MTKRSYCIMDEDLRIVEMSKDLQHHFTSNKEAIYFDEFVSRDDIREFIKLILSVITGKTRSMRVRFEGADSPFSMKCKFVPKKTTVNSGAQSIIAEFTAV